MTHPARNPSVPAAKIDSARGIPCADELCHVCDDSGWQEFISGGIWTGENIIVRREPCHCICGDDVRRELDGRPIS